MTRRARGVVCGPMINFKNLAKVTKTFTLEIGGLRAQGVPAVLLGAAAIVLAAGVARTLFNATPNLPEAFREARGLLGAMRGETALPPSRHD